MPFLWLITLVLYISLENVSYGFTQKELSREGQPKTSEIVLLDGSRISVELYEIRDKNIVFRTIDGKLQSMPLIYVDLQATIKGKDAVKHGSNLESTPGLTTHAPAQSSSENVQNLKRANIKARQRRISKDTKQTLKQQKKDEKEKGMPVEVGNK